MEGSLAGGPATTKVNRCRELACYSRCRSGTLTLSPWHLVPFLLAELDILAVVGPAALVARVRAARAARPVLAVALGLVGDRAPALGVDAEVHGGLLDSVDGR
ncbi:hypothetical protein ON010_g3479 [Phytophthora cinnamomi]|nr:hypothetical protein ON010_g3479 [Phytophthora cinnamomi]